MGLRWGAGEPCLDGVLALGAANNPDSMELISVSECALLSDAEKRPGPRTWRSPRGEPGPVGDSMPAGAMLLASTLPPGVVRPDRVERVAEVRRCPRTGVGARLEVREAGREMAVPELTPAKVGEAGREMRTIVGVLAPRRAAMRPLWPADPSEAASRLRGRVELRFFDLVVRRGKSDGKVEVKVRATRRTGQPSTPATVLLRLREPALDP